MENTDTRDGARGSNPGADSRGEGGSGGSNLRSDAKILAAAAALAAAKKKKRALWRPLPLLVPLLEARYLVLEVRGEEGKGMYKKRRKGMHLEILGVGREARW